MSIEQRRTKRGRVYDVRLRDPSGRPYKRTFKTRREAETYEADQRVGRHRGTWIDPRRATVSFDEIASAWLSSNPAKRPSTVARDEAILRRYLSPRFGTRPIGTIVPSDLQRAVTEWSSDLKPRSTIRVYGVARAVLSYAVANDFIGRTPCRQIKLPQPDAVECRVLDGKDLVRLADALGPNYGAMAYLGAVLGLRWGECAGLRVGRIDWLRRTITIAEQVTRGKGGTLHIGPPKSHAGRRTLSAPDGLLTMLAEVMRRRGLTAEDTAAWVFSTPSGAPLDYAVFRARIWVPALEAAGLTGTKFHDLRRTNATALVESNIDLKTAQARLGHSDPRLTLGVYAQATTAADRRASDDLGARFLPGATEVS